MFETPRATRNTCPVPLTDPSSKTVP